MNESPYTEGWPKMMPSCGACDGTGGIQTPRDCPRCGGTGDPSIEVVPLSDAERMREALIYYAAEDNGDTGDVARRALNPEDKS